MRRRSGRTEMTKLDELASAVGVIRTGRYYVSHRRVGSLVCDAERPVRDAGVSTHADAGEAMRAANRLNGYHILREIAKLLPRDEIAARIAADMYEALKWDVDASSWKDAARDAINDLLKDLDGGSVGGRSNGNTGGTKTPEGS